MSQPLIGEIRMFAGTFAPSGWAFCDGQLLPISEYETLFNLIGTLYGGDGQETFRLPDLRGRLPVHIGGTFVLAGMRGTESVTLLPDQIPGHSHAHAASDGVATSADPAGGVPAQTSTFDGYQSADGTVAMAGSVSQIGGSMPHTNMQPSLGVNFIIALFGIFPTT